MKLTPMTVWRTHTWSAAGGGSSISSSCMTSGPPVLWIRIAFTASAQMLAEERVRPGVGEIGVGLVVVLAGFASKGVVHLGVDVGGHERIALETFDDLLLRFGRAVLILSRDVQHQRLLDLARFVEAILDIDAVIADGGIAVGARGAEERELAAKAVADRAHLAGDARSATQMGDRGLDVGDALVDVEALHQAESLAPILLSFIGELNAGLEPPEQVTRERKAAARRMPVADMPHHVVDAEDLLNDDHARSTARRRRRQICSKISVRAFDSDIFSAHGVSCLPQSFGLMYAP